MLGVEEVLNAIVNYMPRANTNQEAPFSALVFRIDHDKTLGRVAGLRLFGGRLANRDVVKNASQQTEQKVSQIKKV